jgi:hypothetical protein
LQAGRNSGGLFVRSPSTTTAPSLSERPRPKPREEHYLQPPSKHIEESEKSQACDEESSSEEEYSSDLPE